MKKNLFVISEGALAPEYKINAQILDLSQLAEENLQDGDKICISNEACLDGVYSRLVDSNAKTAIDLLKNKHCFREATRSLFPDFNFTKLPLEKIERIERKSVIKPIKGFFSAGVRIVEPQDDLIKIKKEIQEEINRLGEYFSKSVLSSEEWLLEDFIDGEELAVDMYYAEDGQPVILNITHHPMPIDLAYLNVVYWSSEELFKKWQLAIKLFFTYLNTKLLHVTNFPIHAEFRIQKDQLVPIELNPLRFGGFGLADLAYYGLGFNPYNMFFRNETPDWDNIWKEKNAQRFCWTLAYNGKDIDAQKAVPNHKAFMNFCGEENIVYYRPIDWKKQPVFALAYLSVNSENKINELLKADFNQFF